jgi:hypothetical protein
MTHRFSQINLLGLVRAPFVGFVAVALAALMTGCDTSSSRTERSDHVPSIAQPQAPVQMQPQVPTQAPAQPSIPVQSSEDDAIRRLKAQQESSQRQSDILKNQQYTNGSNQYYNDAHRRSKSRSFDPANP